MRKFLFVLVTTLFVSSIANAQINVGCTGNVSIGNGTPGTTHKLEIIGQVKILFPASSNSYASSMYIDKTGYLEGISIYGMANVGKYNASCFDVTSYHFTTPSDERLKENIRNIGSSLDLILKLNGKKYDYMTDPKDDKKLNELKKNHVGFLAQDVIKIIPEVVLYDDSVDIYSIDYTKIIPFITEAIKEQHLVIENLQFEIQELKANAASINNLKSAAITPGTTDIQANSENILDQNAPNPFSQTTTIGYSLNEKVQKALICIYDMNGAQLKCIPLELSLQGKITINGNEFKAGMYMYSLITDGQLIDTKRMILTD